MTHRTVEDYEARLATKVEKWVADHPEETERIQRSIIGPAKPIPIPGSWLREFLDWMVAAEIRKLNAWPSRRDWLSEKPGAKDHKLAAAGDRS